MVSLDLERPKLNGNFIRIANDTLRTPNHTLRLTQNHVTALPDDTALRTHRRNHTDLGLFLLNPKLHRRENHTALRALGRNRVELGVFLSLRLHCRENHTALRTLGRNRVELGVFLGLRDHSQVIFDLAQVIVIVWNNEILLIPILHLQVPVALAHIQTNHAVVPALKTAVGLLQTPLGFRGRVHLAKNVLGLATQREVVVVGHACLLLLPFQNCGLRAANSPFILGQNVL